MTYCGASTRCKADGRLEQNKWDQGEEREMDELEDTRETMEAMDKMVRSELHEVESSVQDT